MSRHERTVNIKISEGGLNAIKGLVAETELKIKKAKRLCKALTEGYSDDFFESLRKIKHLEKGNKEQEVFRENLELIRGEVGKEIKIYYDGDVSDWYDAWPLNELLEMSEASCDGVVSDVTLSDVYLLSEHSIDLE